MSVSGFYRDGFRGWPIGSSAIGRRALAVTAFAAVATMASSIFVGPGPAAKTPGKTYCFLKKCHRVLTLAETRRHVGRTRSVVASFYSHCRVDRFNPCGLTSSGAVYRPHKADNAASPIYPNGTILLVWNPSNKRAAVVRIDNAGPYWGNRTLDLSRAAADKLGFRHRGVARLKVQVLKAPTRQEARYRRRRVYPPVAGYIGRHSSMQMALLATGRSPRTRFAAASQRQPATPAATQASRRVALANIVLPVPNTFKAERRVWLARMVESGPVSVAMSTRPNIRLPVQLVRAELPLPSIEKKAARQRLAALATKSKPQRKLKRKVVRKKSRPITVKAPPRDDKKQSLRSAPKTAPKKPTNKSRAAKVAAGKPAAPVQVSRKPQRQAISAPAAAPAPTVVARPTKRWRRKYLGVNIGGA